MTPKPTVRASADQTEKQSRRRLFDLTGRVALVFGACGGIGREVAYGLAHAGATLMLTDLNGKAAQSLAGDLGANSKSAGIACDVRDASSVNAAFASAVDFAGKLDIVVNLAFASTLKPIGSLSDADFLATLDTCLTGAFRISRAAAGVLIPQQGGGSVIHFSSIAGFAALGRGTGAYAAAKGGLHALIRETAVEWAPHRIRVNGIAPCQTRTPPLEAMLRDPQFGQPGELETRMLSKIPLGRLAEPLDLVGPTVFLASDAAAMVTGQVLAVDGGFLAQ